ncbi:uncharacterized protein LOC124138096 [Haliotis rufescens]|uniref:uncharacterized protein LOC124138096 n=1 Tax=Haliotis rufescens TaxID=6454 RepID=UPI00201F8A29|nr:uncharacterized protein LOC124138096 [Haliotis rufescens]
MNEILLRTHKGEYLPGEDVFGVVYLSIDDPTAGRGIKLIFKGYEHFHYDYRSEGGKNTLEATKDYIDFYNVDLYSSTEPFAIGSYTFPFMMKLPKVLPGTFSAQSESDATWTCMVDYWIQASVTDSDLTATQGIVVQMKLKGEEANKTTELDYVIRKFPFRKSIHFLVRLVDTHPVSGDKMKLRMIITNETSTTISAFKIKLLRDILFICKKDVPLEKLSPRIRRMQQKTYIQPEGGPLVVMETGGNSSGMDPSVLTRVLDNILIPLKSKDGQDLPPSIKGQHIECRYGLEIIITLSNNSIVRINHPVPCLLPKRNTKWQTWMAPSWAAEAKVITSDSRFSVSDDQLNGEAFSALPGFQAL